MATFAFSGRTRAGQTITGERAADTMDAAVAALRREQILVTQITPTREKAAKTDKAVKDKAGAAKNLAIFTRQFSVMIDAGLPLVQCLEILGNQEEDKNFSGVILSTRAEVESGASLADAISKLDNIESVTPGLTRRMRLSPAVRPEETPPVAVDAVSYEYAPGAAARSLPGLDGRLPGRDERGAAAIEREVAESLGVELNQQVRLQQRTGAAALPLTVVGLFDSQRVAEHPAIFDAEPRPGCSRFLGQPFLELLLQLTARGPELILFVADFDVRPGEIHAAMVQVVFGKVVGQRFAIEAVDGVKIAGPPASARCFRPADTAVVVDEDGFFAVEQTERLVVDGLEAEGGWFRRRSDR